MKHIKIGEDVAVLAFGFQDALFDNSDRCLEFSGNNYGALWPGDGKPRLWLNAISRMGTV